VCLFDEDPDGFLGVLEGVEEVGVDFALGLLIDGEHGALVAGLGIRDDGVEIEFVHPIFLTKRLPHLIVQLHGHFPIVVVGDARLLVVVGLVGSHAVGLLLYLVLGDAAVV
jgi:hypothetical protein